MPGMSEKPVMRRVEDEVALESPDPSSRGDISWTEAGVDRPPTADEYRRLVEAYGRLEEENRRRTVALATAAHELKTPLSIMAGYLELLLSDKLGALSERQRQVLTDMRENGVRALAAAFLANKMAAGSGSRYRKSVSCGLMPNLPPPTRLKSADSFREKERALCGFRFAFISPRHVSQAKSGKFTPALSEPNNERQ